eukprot:TRINITY_DN16589_c0_g1_i1.p1 TRINITY_DN16589_c0_g1~~TRINITY_DN16589_c0_g1_i1.p1  ORF type:complete len:417 (+),score=64.76 TRINITY_DN16589_c0_g1_i1:78-1253(+)
MQRTQRRAYRPPPEGAASPLVPSSGRCSPARGPVSVTGLPRRAPGPTAMRDGSLAGTLSPRCAPPPSPQGRRRAASPSPHRQPRSAWGWVESRSPARRGGAEYGVPPPPYDVACSPPAAPQCCATARFRQRPSGGGVAAALAPPPVAPAQQSTGARRGRPDQLPQMMGDICCHAEAPAAPAAGGAARRSRSAPPPSGPQCASSLQSDGGVIVSNAPGARAFGRWGRATGSCAPLAPPTTDMADFVSPPKGAVSATRGRSRSCSPMLSPEPAAAASGGWPSPPPVRSSRRKALASPPDCGALSGALGRQGIAGSNALVFRHSYHAPPQQPRPRGQHLASTHMARALSGQGGPAVKLSRKGLAAQPPLSSPATVTCGRRSNAALRDRNCGPLW